MCNGEKGNTWTHLIGAVFALASMWVIWPAVKQGWQMTMGVIFFIVGMFLMFLSSTIYHWLSPGRVKQAMRKLDHISIYVGDGMAVHAVGTGKGIRKTKWDYQPAMTIRNVMGD